MPLKERNCLRTNNKELRKICKPFELQKQIYQLSCFNRLTLSFHLFAFALTTPARKILLVFLHLPEYRAVNRITRLDSSTRQALIRYILILTITKHAIVHLKQGPEHRNRECNTPKPCNNIEIR
jgi:hypothetical protein